jgi:hypothetical protein
VSNELNVLKLRTLLGDYPNTLALKKSEIRPSGFVFDFADVKVPNTAFKDVVRHLKYDVAELAIVTYLQARAHGKPLALLPAVVVGTMPHPFLVYKCRARPDLTGRSQTPSRRHTRLLRDDSDVAPRHPAERSRRRSR